METHLFKLSNVELELSKDFTQTIMSTILSPGQTHIPALWERHIRLCLQHKQIVPALLAIRHFQIDISGTNIDLKPLENMIYNSKEYKDYQIYNKKIQIDQDFV